MLNRIVIMGRLTRDPELRYTQNKTPVAAFTLAVDRDFGDKATDFIDCVAWRQTAEFVSKYFSKGAMDSVYFGSSKQKSEDGEETAYARAERYGRFDEYKNTPDAYRGIDVLTDADDGDFPF